MALAPYWLMPTLWPLPVPVMTKVPEALRTLGIKHLICEPKQMVIDGDFPTVVSPNPENPEGFYLAIDLARENDVDFILGTDPDSDRVGIMIRDHSGEYRPVTGNQTGVLLLDYLIGAMRRSGKMPEKPVALKTIVTTEMARKVAESNGVTCYDTFTGFKFMAEKKNALEAAGEGKVIFSYEESYGYMLGDYVRDKDAVNATLLVCEAAAWYAKQGMTLLDAINKLYAEFGCYRNALHSFAFEGESGMHTMDAIMKQLRQTPPTAIGGMAVESMVDYNTAGTGLPKANVLEFRLAGGAKLMVRPSGTEPKIKVYLSAVAPTEEAADAINDTLGKAAAALLKA